VPAPTPKVKICQPGRWGGTSGGCSGNKEWFFSPGLRGDCGDECHVRKTAWVNDSFNLYAFGVQGGTLVFRGTTDGTWRLHFSEMELSIDGKSFGRFSVGEGLNGDYVLPVHGTMEARWSRMSRALRKGKTLFAIGDNFRLGFTLRKSNAALKESLRISNRNW